MTEKLVDKNDRRRTNAAREKLKSAVANLSELQHVNFMGCIGDGQNVLISMRFNQASQRIIPPSIFGFVRDAYRVDHLAIDNLNIQYTFVESPNPISDEVGYACMMRFHVINLRETPFEAIESRGIFSTRRDDVFLEPYIRVNVTLDPMTWLIRQSPFRKVPGSDGLVIPDVLQKEEDPKPIQAVSGVSELLRVCVNAKRRQLPSPGKLLNPPKGVRARIQASVLKIIAPGESERIEIPKIAVTSKDPYYIQEAVDQGFNPWNSLSN